LCQGDSRGPDINEDGILVGVISAVEGYTNAAFPDIYIRISIILDFVM
jgi:hypothetical protein